MFEKNIGIDLGTASVLIYVRGKGIVLREPSVVAIDRTTGKILKVGVEAQEMLGRTPGNILAIRPLRDGVISDYETTERMLKYFIKRVNGHSIFRPNIVVCIPSRINEVEERAVRDAALNAGAKTVELIEEPMAAAIGAGIDISKPRGVMVIDIGGGTADIAVISLVDVVVSESVKVAGDRFDEALVKFIRKEWGILIGERTAEDIKMRIGCLSPRPEKLSMTVRGRDLTSGLPREFTITSEDTMEAYLEPGRTVAEATHDVLSRTPPELIGDISLDGIIMTGGGSLIYGFDKMIAEYVGIRVYVADDAVSCVAKGTGAAFELVGDLSAIKANSPNKKLWG